MKKNIQRSWINPFTAVTFAAVATMGLMMLIYIKSSGVYQIHQWGDLVSIIIGAVHLLLKWGILAGAMLLIFYIGNGTGK